MTRMGDAPSWLFKSNQKGWNPLWTYGSAQDVFSGASTISTVGNGGDQEVSSAAAAPRHQLEDPKIIVTRCVTVCNSEFEGANGSCKRSLAIAGLEKAPLKRG
jgi:hypothetical protein